MEAAVSLVGSNGTPFCSALSPSGYLISRTHFNKHLNCEKLMVKSLRLTAISSVLSNHNSQLYSNSPFSALTSPSNRRILGPLRLIRCYNAPMDSERLNPFVEGSNDFSFKYLKSTLSQLTPIAICKWCLVLSIATAVLKWSVNTLLNPFVWMYFSWTWLFWPWMVAIAIAAFGLYSLTKYLKGEASLLNQLSIVTSAFTWLTLVPSAHFNGFLEGWPFVFFFVYHYFFFLNVSVRKRLYGDYYPREHDGKWDISLPNWQKLLFCGGVMVAHWLAAMEGLELHLIPGGWNNVGIWGLIMLTVFMQYHSTLYLAKYSEKVVVPTAVVQFGPYRFIRHPIYASTMLLFVTYFTALRAPMSTIFVVAVCLMYYGQKANLEEALMLETFRESYSEYMNKVRHKLIPFVY